MRLCIFGASSGLIEEKYIKSAYDLSAGLAQKGHSLVFGGGDSGVMGACARGFDDNGGFVLGVAPHFMSQYSVYYNNCTEFKLTETMAERKTFMEDNADAFIIAPGGIGTYEELFEVYTLKQLGRHTKPIIIFNAHGYYSKLVEVLEHTVKEEFMKKSSLDLIAVFDNAEDINAYLDTYQPEEFNVKKERYNKS